MQFIRLLMRLQKKIILVNLFCLIAAKTVGPLHILTQMDATRNIMFLLRHLTLYTKQRRSCYILICSVDV